MNHIYTPGPGDSATWPACSGHPLDPRTDFAFDARDEAEAEVLATPALFSIWLDDHAIGEQAVDTSRLGEDLSDCSVDTLITVLLTSSSDQQILRARWFLREKFLAASERAIAERAAELEAA